MSGIDASAVPSVRARLAELKQPKPHMPQKRRPPPPPPPPLSPGTAARPKPPLPPRKAVPPLPQRPSLPPRDEKPHFVTLPEEKPRLAEEKPCFIALDEKAPRYVPLLPIRTKTAPVVATLPARKLPPQFIPQSPLPVPRTAPGLPARSHTEPSLPPVTAARKLPPLPRRYVPAPPPLQQTPPPIPTASRPPPIPLSTRPPINPTTPTAPQKTCLLHRSFAHADAHAAQPHPTHSLSALATSLTTPFPSATDKARAIFTYLHHTISYDFSGFLGTTPRGAQDALSVLRTGKSVCQGYAALFLALATEAGMHAALVTGHGKGYSHAPGKRLAWPPNGHAWNVVMVDGGEWWLVDACWGAGYVSAEAGYTRRFAPEMFEMHPEEFGRKHFAADDRWNLGGGDWEAYQQEEDSGGRKAYLAFTEKLGFVDEVGPLAPLPRRLPAGGGWTEFRFVKAPCCCLPYEPPAEGEWLAFINVGEEFKKENWTALQRLDGGRVWAAEVYVPAGVAKVTLSYASSFDGRDGRGVSWEEWTGKWGKVAVGWGQAAEWTV